MNKGKKYCIKTNELNGRNQRPDISGGSKDADLISSCRAKPS